MSAIKTSAASLVPRFDRSESPYIEPGLLGVFRLYVMLQIGIWLIGAGSAWLLLPTLDLLPIALLSISQLVLLLLYLYWSGMRRRLKRAYLPLALLWLTAVSMIPSALLIYVDLQSATPQISNAEVISAGWSLLLSLTVPLVFVAWQYNFRVVFIYAVGVALFSIALHVLVVGGDSPLWQAIVEQALTGTVIFILVGYIITHLVSLQRDREKALEDVNTRLVDQAATIEQLSVSRERNRMARDMHDTLAHSLSSVIVQLEAADSAWEQAPQSAHLQLLKALANARSGLDETRRALQALRASPLDDLGLPLAIRTLAEATAARNGMALDLDIETELYFSPAQEQNIYRIAQEAIANIVNHAQADTLKVVLKRDNEMTELTIADNGTGFNPQSAVKIAHYGLQGMQERAYLIGADLQIDSQPQQGTTVRMTLKRRA